MGAGSGVGGGSSSSSTMTQLSLSRGSSNPNSASPSGDGNAQDVNDGSSIDDATLVNMIDTSTSGAMGLSQLFVVEGGINLAGGNGEASSSNNAEKNEEVNG